MKDVNPATQPPTVLLRQAQELATQLHSPVYLFQSSDGWGFTAKLTEVPSGALITEIRGNPEASESWNTGGC